MSKVTPPRPKRSSWITREQLNQMKVQWSGSSSDRLIPSPATTAPIRQHIGMQAEWTLEFALTVALDKNLRPRWEQEPHSSGPLLSWFPFWAWMYPVLAIFRADIVHYRA